MTTEQFVRIVARAVRSGVELRRAVDGALEIEAPPQFVHLGRALRRRDEDVLKLYDWRHASIGESAPCALCRQPAMLRDPVEEVPCHKVCCDAMLRAAAVRREGDGRRD